jgi:6-pyruvoyltetrahydropterin/6-carboxytetrahydropterin synthase
MSSSYRVVVERNRLKFAAAHMATFLGDLEPLHGHNYALHLEVEGSLTSDSWVIDFAMLKRIGREVCDRLDHKFLLQGASSAIEIDRGDEVAINLSGRRYVFPAENVSDLPIDNTTAERLAEWIGGEVLAALRGAGADNISRLRVGVEEAPGQSGWWESER